MVLTKKHILLATAALTLAACSTTPDTDSPTPAADKTPVDVSVSLADVATKTRAVDGSFDNKDQLVAHIRHVDTSTDAVSVVESLSRTVIFTYSSTDGSVTPADPLYWDDFSSVENDIRTDKHALQSEWGYCYNGGTAPTTYADELTWEATADQTNSYKTCDLLWSKSQDPVAYEHLNSSNDEKRKGLTIPYTHAMSKMTIKLTVADGFTETTVFDKTTATLNGINTKGKFTASTATVAGDKDDATFTTGDISMHHQVSKADKTITFDALFVPTTLKTGETLATINDVAGNNYTIPVTDAMLAEKAWNCANASTKSGINYELNVKVSKQKISVTATIANWETKTTTADAEIKFSTDLTGVTPAEDLTDGTSYDIFRATEENGFSEKTTTRTYTKEESATTGTWSNDPEIYWQDASTSYYFRGLAKLEADGKITSVEGSKEAAQGTDLLWATTAKHTGTATDGTTQKTLEEGAAIAPRTSHVPMQFKHAMSKVTFKLTTTDDENKKVDLIDAKITIPGLVTDGTIDVATGAIKVGSNTSDLSTTSGAATIVIPQDLTGKTMTITLKDGTTYNVTLTNCKVEDKEITAWEGGTSYTYTITLAKEAIQFRALIKEWTEKTGSGDATLDWD